MSDDDDTPDGIDTEVTNNYGVVIGGGKLGKELADLVGRVLRPTADQLGGFFGDVTAFYRDQWYRTLTKAEEKAKRIGVEDQPMHPRVAYDFLKDSAFADTEIASEYYSGLAASAKADGKDETVFYLSIIRDLSADQIAFHYILYSYFIRKQPHAYDDFDSYFFSSSRRKINRTASYILSPYILSEATDYTVSKVIYLLESLASKGLVKDASDINRMADDLEENQSRSILFGTSENNKKHGYYLQATTLGYGLFMSSQAGLPKEVAKVDIPVLIEEFRPTFLKLLPNWSFTEASPPAEPPPQP